MNHKEVNDRIGFIKTKLEATEFILEKAIQLILQANDNVKELELVIREVEERVNANSKK